jgi:hypothetical protein
VRWQRLSLLLGRRLATLLSRCCLPALSLLLERRLATLLSRCCLPALSLLLERRLSTLLSRCCPPALSLLLRRRLATLLSRCCLPALPLSPRRRMALRELCFFPAQLRHLERRLPALQVWRALHYQSVLRLCQLSFRLLSVTWPLLARLLFCLLRSQTCLVVL